VVVAIAVAVMTAATKEAEMAADEQVVVAMAGVGAAVVHKSAKLVGSMEGGE